MDRRLIVPTIGGIGLLYCAYMMVEAMVDEGWTVWGICALAVMVIGSIVSFVIAWNRNKLVKAEAAYYEKLREEEKAQREIDN